MKFSKLKIWCKTQKKNNIYRGGGSKFSHCDWRFQLESPFLIQFDSFFNCNSLSFEILELLQKLRGRGEWNLMKMVN